MARRSSLLRVMMQAQREAERKRAFQLREMNKTQTETAKAAEKAKKDYEKARIANQKEQAKLYTESRIAQVQLQNEQLEQQIKSLEHILLDAYSVDPYIDIQTLKQTSNLPPFDAGPLAIAEALPPFDIYAVPELTGLQKFLPGAKEKHAQHVVEMQKIYEGHVAEHANRDRARQYALAQARANYERQLAEEWRRIAAQHAEIDVFQREFLAGSLQAVIDYFKMVLDSSLYPDGFPQQTKLAYIPESRQLVVEYDLPSFEIVPVVGVYKYVKAKDSITETPRPAAQRRTLYVSVIAQVTLRTLYELFKSDRLGQLDTIVFTAMLIVLIREQGALFVPVSSLFVPVAISSQR
jgi:restriction system protein